MASVNKHNWFPTIGYSGHIDIDKSTINDYRNWMKVQKEIRDSSYGTTTKNGYQCPLDNSMSIPKWYETLYEQLTDARLALQPSVHKSTWVIDYEPGGYQETHIHHVSETLVLNISGEGVLMLADPRPMAVCMSEPWYEYITLKSGDWITIPGWLGHASSPCEGPRSIMVMDFIL
jgi:hypothetical protein